MPTDTIIGLIITIILGFGWGSFATMAIYRIPRGMPWIGDKPRCLLCGHELNLIDYFSIFSYFLWRGKCRYCGGKFECNLGYFFTEFLITGFFILCYLQYGFSDEFVLLTLLVVACVVMAVVDAEHKRIPAKILVTTLAIGLVYRTFIDQTFYGALYGSIAGGLAGLAIRHIYFSAKGQADIAQDYTKWQHTDRFAGLGFDYVKLLAIGGIFLPLPDLLLFIFLCGGLILCWHIIHAGTLRIGSIMAIILNLMVIYS